MNKKITLHRFVTRLLSYVLVAAAASAVTWCLAALVPSSKLERLEAAIDQKFIGESNQTQIQDAAAEAMIGALGDRWSYYISAEEYAEHLERQNNSYVGIGVSVIERTDGQGIDIIAVEPEGPAAEAGIQVGDILTHADGTFLGDLGMTKARNLIMGEKNTQVVLTVLRQGETLEIPVTRRVIQSKIVESRMLDGSIGYIQIDNFHGNAGEETLEAVKTLQAEGAEKLIFDVRSNPGGYVHEMVEVLDYLLPEGPLFRSIDYNGKESVDESDAACLELPMAVLINGNTYSAAEFFAAALHEYNWAITVGEPTTGKGYYQTTIELGDGSAVQLSTGAYTTPNGVNLTEVGGLQPDVPVAPAEESVMVQMDPQILAAVEALEKK